MDPSTSQKLTAPMNMYKKSLEMTLMTLSSSMDQVQGEINNIQQVKKSLLASSQAVDASHQPSTTFLGDCWWVQTGPKETLSILSRKEEALKEKLSEITKSMKDLEEECNLYRDLIEQAKDTVDIREQLPHDLSQSVEITNEMQSLTIDPMTTVRVNQSKSKKRVAHSSQLQESPTPRSPHDKAQEIQKLNDIFDRYEKEELKHLSPSKSSHLAVPSIKDIPEDAHDTPSPPASFHPSESELSESFHASDDDEPTIKETQNEPITEIFPMSESHGSLQELLQQTTIHKPTKHVQEDTITMISSSPPKISKFMSNKDG